MSKFQGEHFAKDLAFDDLDDFVDADDTLDYMETEDKVPTREINIPTKEMKVPTRKMEVPTVQKLVPIGKVKVLIIMSQNKEKLKGKEKGVEIRNVEETERPRSTSTRSILTLRPLPKINLKDKGKKRIKEEDESDTKLEGITEAEKKFKQLANDEEARLNADKILAKKLQEEERERCILLSREPNFFMTPLLPKEDFLLNKDLKLSEINLL
ncbi:hypothetical protein Tco_0219039 [Tanacetum coccineum]